MTPTQTRPIRVALVDDNPGIRESLGILINGTPGFCCVGAQATAEDAVAAIPTLCPDVVLMDIRLPNLSGIDCVRRLKGSLPTVQFVMLTAFEDDALVFEALRAGASGYILKRTPPADLLESIAEVHRGGSPMSSTIARKVVGSFRHPASPSNPATGLSCREAEVLAALSQGYRYKEIADRFGISVDTVRSHIRRIYDKLHVHSRTEAVVRFLKG